MVCWCRNNGFCGMKIMNMLLMFLLFLYIIIYWQFVCHHSSFIVYNSLRDNTPKRWVITTHSAIGISLFFSMWLAIAGFFHFQTQTEGDILNNFAWDNTPINFARALLALTMVFTFPMENVCIFKNICF